MINFIPLSKIPNQMFQIDLNDQNCTIILTQRAGIIYFSLSVDDIPILKNIICEDRTPLILYNHLNFIGDLFFMDMLGNDRPNYEGLGDRFILVYTDEV